jgi:glycosyltransferase involved in cell wall biosynthesis
MKIIVVGLRGFPQVQGGIEKHSEHLYPLLAKYGCQTTVAVRSPYMKNYQGDLWRGVQLKRIWAPKIGGIETFVHTFLGVAYAILKKPDIVHVHAIGPSFWVPLLRLFNQKVIVTIHGLDYERQKFGFIARTILLLGEKWAIKYANKCIAVSQSVADKLSTKYQVNLAVIKNGIDPPVIIKDTDFVRCCNLLPGKYILLVSRIDPDKRHIDLMEAFEKANLNGWKLVLVGSSDHPNKHERKVLNKAANTKNVISLGFRTGKELAELYSHAALFVLPSAKEGFPIALLEALSYGLKTIASDIPPNLEVGMKQEHYYKLGDINELTEKLKLFSQEDSEITKKNRREQLLEHYSWDKIAKQTLNIYHVVLNKNVEKIINDCK